MDFNAAGFDWDEGNWPKCGQHGLKRSEIEALFKAAPDVYPDPGHSHSERRLLAIGHGNGGRRALVAFTLRETPEGWLIRPISARYMHRKEVDHYERQKHT
jgi:hypothetical protein